MNLFLMRQSMSQVPDAMIEAAKVDGAGLFRVCWQIVMPNQKPALTGIQRIPENPAYCRTAGSLGRSGQSRCGNGRRRIHAGAADCHLYAGTAAGNRNNGTFRNQGLKRKGE